MKLPGFLNPKNIGGQIAALVVASIMAIHLILAATFLVYRPDQAPIERGNSQLAAVAQLLGAAPATGRPRLFADIARAFPQLAIASLLPGPGLVADEPSATIRSKPARCTPPAAERPRSSSITSISDHPSAVRRSRMAYCNALLSRLCNT
jgi:hypothetical protein